MELVRLFFFFWSTSRCALHVRMRTSYRALNTMQSRVEKEAGGVGRGVGGKKK